MSYAPGSIMDPVTNIVNATVCDPFPLPDVGSVDTEALVADIYKRMPAYLWHFLPRKATTVESSIPLPVPSQAAAMEEDCPPGPSAQPAAPTEATKAELPAGPSDLEVPTYVKENNPETSPASTDLEGEFTEVYNTKSQKRKLKASKSLANPPKKASVSVPKPKPSANVRPDLATSASSSTASSEAPADSPMEEPVKDRVPPLYIREKNKWEKLVPILDSQGIAFLHARSTAVGIRVQCPDSTNHRRLTALLRSEKIGFHTYALQDERVIRAVIRGLPREIDPAAVKEDLLAQGLPVQQVHRMYHPRLKHPFDMVLVILDLIDGKKIFEVKSVCRLSGLKVQEPKGRSKIGQCHNCQIYGHSARNCFAKSRCVKCLGDHGTSDCLRKQPTEEPPSCVLCGAKGHPANYRGCPKAPKEPRRRVKPAGHSAPPPPEPQKFVPAPAPATNAWHKPLLRAAPAPIPAATLAPGCAAKAGPAPAAKLTPKPSAVAPAPATPPTDSSTSFSSNWKYVSVVIDSIDLEQLNVFVQKAKINLEQAIFEHNDLLTAIKACKKTLNG